jgi:hypothetical protein
VYKGLKIKLLIAAAASLLAGTVPGQASQWHQFDIINNSSQFLTISSFVGRCVGEIDGITGVNPGSRATIKWNDSNDYGEGCTNRDKFVTFQVNWQGWSGWLGITHRKLTSDWYNGQFYASFLSVTGNGYSFTDGSPPPSSVKALCEHNNDCFGPFSQMEDAGKNGYNWQHSYRTESGWAFEFN